MRSAPEFLIITACCGAAHAAAGAECPATTSADPLFGTSIAGWYGTEALAVGLSSPARWSTTQPGYLIGQKVFWRSSGFRPGTESRLTISIRNLDGGPVTGRISAATNAYVPAVQPNRDLSGAEGRELANEALTSADGWRMLTGIDFPDPGCWEITAAYLGQTLTFVVQTIDPPLAEGRRE